MNNLQDILNLARKRLDDERGKDSKKGWQDWELVEYATISEQDIARELYLLEDKDTIGYLTLDGVAGQVSSVSVSGVTITSGAVVFSTSLTALASAVAVNINAYTSTPNYRAVSRGTLVIIKANPQTGYPAAGYSLTATASGGITAVATNLPGLCRHIVAIGQRFLALHEKVIAITRFKPLSQSRPINEYTRDDLDYHFSGWEAYPNGSIAQFSPDYENNEVIVVSPPNAVELIEQDCYRLPLADFDVNKLTAVPEIKPKYWPAMVERMMQLAYEKNDVETQDLSRSKTHGENYKNRIEGWKIEAIRRTPHSGTNQVPAGLM